MQCSIELSEARATQEGAQHARAGTPDGVVARLVLEHEGVLAGGVSLLLSGHEGGITARRG